MLKVFTIREDTFIHLNSYFHRLVHEVKLFEVLFRKADLYMLQ